MLENKIKTQKLKEALPSRYAQIVARSCGVHTSWVYQVLNNWDTDSPVLSALIDLAEQNQLKKRELTNRLNKIEKLKTL